MIGLDTNILIRYFLKDDVQQALKSADFLKNTCRKTDPCFVSTIVLCELSWVLKSVYKIDNETILNILEKTIQTGQFKIQDLDHVREAIYDCQKFNISFADSLIGKLSIKYGCSNTITFDKTAARSKDFTLL